MITETKNLIEEIAGVVESTSSSDRMKMGFTKIIEKATLSGREEERKREIDFLNRLSDDVDSLQKDYANLDICNKVDVIRLIETRLKELENG